jgi:protein TonB
MTAATAGKSSAPRASLYLKSINVIGLSDELAEKVRASLPVHVGDAFGNDQIAQVRAALKEIDEHLMYSIRNSPPDTMLTVMLRPSGVIGGVIGGAQSGVIERVPGVLSEVKPDSAPVATVSIPNPPPGVTRVRIGGNVAAANLIRKVIPVYPPLAKQARIQGTVRFTAIIGTDGNVVSLQLVEGHPLLVEAAQDAVSQWQYQPTLLNGAAVQVITQIDVNFTLSQ